MSKQVYKSQHKIREVYDLSYISDRIDSLYQTTCKIGTKKAQGAGVRVGGSNDRDNISNYRYINTKKMLLTPELYDIIHDIISRIGIDTHVLTHNILHLPPQGFLDWQDYYMWQKRSIRTSSFQVIGPVINFFSISLTDNNKVGFREQIIDVDKNHAILFAPGDEHMVPKSTHDRMWLVLGVADHVDINTTLK